FGDSHADHWSTPLIEAAKKNDHKVVTWLKSACRASRLTVWSSKLKRDYTECDQWREQSIKQIIALRPSLVVISEISLTTSRKLSPDAQQSGSLDQDWQAGL
ncbi:SGNH hydrolase domain-containing protein, partial [Mesorhizobium sp.]